MVFCLFCKANTIEAFQHVVYSYIICAKCLLSPKPSTCLSYSNQKQGKNACTGQVELKSSKQRYFFKRISVLKQSIQESTLQLQKDLTNYLTTLSLTNLRHPDFQLYTLLQNFFQRRKQQQQIQQMIPLEMDSNFNRFSTHPHSKMGGSQYLRNLEWLGSSVTSIGQKISSIREKTSQIDIQSYLQKGKQIDLKTYIKRGKQISANLLRLKPHTETEACHDQQKTEKCQDHQQYKKQSKQIQQKIEVKKQQLPTKSRIGDLKDSISSKKQSLYNSLGNLKQQMRTLKLQTPKINKEHIKSILKFKFF